MDALPYGCTSIYTERFRPSGLVWLLWTVVVGAPEARFESGWPALLLAGLMVGIGTRYGAGCTSGHGVCGLARLSPRSLVATLVFMTAGFLSTYVLRHLIGGGL